MDLLETENELSKTQISEQVINEKVSTQLKISVKSVSAVLKLTAEGATVPFIARYRKEVTHNLDETQIREVIEASEKFIEVFKRKDFIQQKLQELGKLTPEIARKIEATFDSQVLEDIYAPFKVKKKTKGTIAKEKGLEPLALQILEGAFKKGQIPDEVAAPFVNAEKEVKTSAEALAGAFDILIEMFANDVDFLAHAREVGYENGFLASEKAKNNEEKNSKFEPYFNFREKITSIAKKENSHRFLALTRGQKEKHLSVKIETPDEVLISQLKEKYHRHLDQLFANELSEAIDTAYRVYVKPKIETEVKARLKKSADEGAIHVFEENLKNLLLSAPLGSVRVLGVDPGIRTGCKLALVDENGNYLGSQVVFPDGTEAQKQSAEMIILKVIQELKIKAIAIGNGTAGRETELFFRKFLNQHKFEKDIICCMISESGASIYSASPVAKEEFPDLDLTIRGAISIARRLQDPLAELVKLDPKHIGVGQYQHDVNQKLMADKLTNTVEYCVNKVGINLNTASHSLLRYVSGVGEETSKAVVAFRKAKGNFKNKKDLLEVPRFSEKIFEQAAGFLRIRQGENPLDNTGIHPERYDVVREMAEALGCTTQQLLGSKDLLAKLEAQKSVWVAKVGEFTFNDIVQQLRRPGLDDRKDFEYVQFKEGVFELKDLQVDMVLNGMVSNVTNFGAFVDIGVHQDGLVHISELSNQFVKDPHTVVKVGQKVKVKVLKADLDKKQISLSIKQAMEAGTGAYGAGSSERRPIAPIQARVTSTNEGHGGSGRRPQPNIGTGTAGRPQQPAYAAARDQHARPQSHAGSAGGARPHQGPRPVAQKPINPDSPFAALAKLKIT